MALAMTLANRDHSGTLDGVHAVATTSGTTGAVTFAASRRPTTLGGTPVAIAAASLGAGQYELTLSDSWLWWVRGTDAGGATADMPVWVWKSDYSVDEEACVSLVDVIRGNKLALEARMAHVSPVSIEAIIYGERQEVDTVPSIEAMKTDVDWEYSFAPYGRRYTIGMVIACYSHWSEDMQSDQSLLGQMATSLRDTLFLYEEYALASGLHVFDGRPGRIEYAETVGLDNKLIGMATMPWSCKAEYSVPGM